MAVQVATVHVAVVPGVNAVAIMTVITPSGRNNSRHARSTLAIGLHAAFHGGLAVGGATFGIALPHLRLSRQNAACGDEKKGELLEREHVISLSVSDPVRAA